MENALHDEWPNLDFLDVPLDTRHSTAYWLKSEFSANKWRGDFGDGLFLDIDFHVTLEDKTFLTDLCNVELLSIFKSWLCVQSSYDHQPNGTFGAKRTSDRVCMVLSIIDYFLLNSSYFRLSENGLLRITEHDLNELIINRSRASKISVALYEWPKRAADYLRSVLSDIADQEYEKIIDSHPDILYGIPNIDGRATDLSTEEIVKSRCWLLKSGLYLRKRAGAIGKIKSEEFRRIVFANTIRGGVVGFILPELSITDIWCHSREYERVPVKNYDANSLSKERLKAFINCIRSLGVLGEQKIPISAIENISFEKLEPMLGLKGNRTYAFLPQNIAFDALRNAIDFVIDYGNVIVDCFLELIEIEFLSSPKKSSGFSLLPEGAWSSKLSELNIKTWNGQMLDGKERVFENLRSEPGLYQALKLLYGCMFTCVGALTARRDGELQDLFVGQCLDVSERHLLFHNRKSGVGSYREKEARPVPKIVVRCFKLAERLQSKLLKLGILEGPARVFAYPAFRHFGLIDSSLSRRLSDALDIFCDYFQTPLDELGRRYYVRQHQLRGFFATTLFWSANLPNASDTLRWYLGHTDVLHLYHYIKQITPSYMFRSISAEYTASLIEREESSVAALANFIEARFQIRTVNLMNHEELVDIIYELSLDNCFDIAPVPYLTDSGETYTFLYTVTEKDPCYG